VVNCWKFYASIEYTFLKIWQFGIWSMQLMLISCINIVYTLLCFTYFLIIDNDVYERTYILDWNRYKLQLLKWTSTRGSGLCTSHKSDDFCSRLKKLRLAHTAVLVLLLLRRILITLESWQRSNEEGSPTKVYWIRVLFKIKLLTDVIKYSYLDVCLLLIFLVQISIFIRYKFYHNCWGGGGVKYVPQRVL